MSSPSALSLYNKHRGLSAARSPHRLSVVDSFLSAESSNNVFLYPTISVSRHHAHDKPGGVQSSFCALHGMIEFIAAQLD